MPGNYSHTTRATGTVLTASIYNSDHQNHIDNNTPTGNDDYSVDATQMRVNTDPGEQGSESLATSEAGEFERLRFTIKELKTTLNGAAVAQWYSTPAFGGLTTKGDLIGHNGTNNVRLGVGSNTQILTADSTQTAGFKWADNPPPFAATTAIVFAQTSAPTGWTKSVTHNDKALRVVSGTAGSGGATAFTSVFGASKSTGSYALVTADLPAHSHGITGSPGISDPGHGHTQKHFTAGAQNNDNTVATSGFSTTPASWGPNSITTSSDGTGISVNAGTLGTSNTGSGTAHSHTLSLDLQYVDVIIATKD